jgi:2-keto-3-deoxy-L-fuconate dehydrogenase
MREEIQEMNSRLAGKRVLITAAGQGIGRASALAMADAGAEVWATDISENALSELPDGLNRRVLNVLDVDQIADCVNHVQPDVLFNCAGVVHHGSILDATEAEWAQGFGLNVTPMFHTIRAVLPGMLDRGAGSIINMSSVVSSIIGAPDRCIYGASKGAVIGLTKSVAKDYVAKGIRCNAICPGTVDSPSWRDRVAALGEKMGSLEAAHEAFVARQPMGRVAQSEEIAALVVYLASDESAFTTGQVHVIDGGWAG